MLVLRFGMVHDEDCEELSTTNDWVPFADVSEESVEELDFQSCPCCLG